MFYRDSALDEMKMSQQVPTVAVAGPASSIPSCTRIENAEGRNRFVFHRVCLA